METKIQKNEITEVQVLGEYRELPSPLALDNPKVKKLLAAIEFVESELGFSDDLEARLRDTPFSEPQRDFLKALLKNKKMTSPEIVKELGLKKPQAIAGIRGGLYKKGKNEKEYEMPELVDLVLSDWDYDEQHNMYWINPKYRDAVNAVFGGE